MTTRRQWQRLVVRAYDERIAPVTARSFLARFDTSTDPVALRCDDGLEYVVKGQQAGRSIATDHIVGRLGMTLGAPVGRVRVVRVASELIDMVPAMKHIPPGLCHGSELISECSNWQWVDQIKVPGNKERFALLAVLYGWTQAGDCQFLYRNRDPRLVFSVDHGHFLPGGPKWNRASLRLSSAADLDQGIERHAGLRPSDYANARLKLGAVGDSMIAQAVAAPPDEWNVSEDDRIALAQYLARRRDQLLKRLAGRC